MNKYETFKGLFVITLVVAMAMMIGIIDQQTNKIQTLKYRIDMDYKVNSDLFDMVEDKVAIIDQLETQAVLNKNNYNELMRRSINKVNYYKDNQHIIIQNQTKVRVGSITIEIKDRCEVGMYAGGCSGWTDGYRIYIVNNQSLEYMKLVCNHEILHTVIDMEYDEEEEFIRSIDDKFNFRECEAFFSVM